LDETTRGDEDGSPAHLQESGGTPGSGVATAQQLCILVDGGCLQGRGAGFDEERRRGSVEGIVQCGHCEKEGRGTAPPRIAALNGVVMWAGLQ
jgi:hypothetical protein